MGFKLFVYWVEIQRTLNETPKCRKANQAWKNKRNSPKNWKWEQNLGRSKWIITNYTRRNWKFKAKLNFAKQNGYRKLIIRTNWVIIRLIIAKLIIIGTKKSIIIAIIIIIIILRWRLINAGIMLKILN